MTLKKALLLIGSPKTNGGTSMIMAEYLASRLRDINVDVEIKHVHQAIEAGKEDELFDAIERAEAVVLLFPLYIDSLPSGVVRFFELFLERKGEKGGKDKPFYAIANSGAPESIQSTVALEICVLFARDTGFAWNGGGAVGGGAHPGRQDPRGIRRQGQEPQGRARTAGSIDVPGRRSVQAGTGPDRQAPGAEVPVRLLRQQAVAQDRGRQRRGRTDCTTNRWPRSDQSAIPSKRPLTYSNTLRHRPLSGGCRSEI